MLDPFNQMLRDWQNFFMLTGTASATLVGLMFIAATLGSNLAPQDERLTINTWVTPTIIHFSTVLIFAVLVAVPTLTGQSFGLLLGLFGLLGLGYVARVGYRMWQKKSSADFSTTVW